MQEGCDTLQLDHSEGLCSVGSLPEYKPDPMGFEVYVESSMITNKSKYQKCMLLSETLNRDFLGPHLLMITSTSRVFDLSLVQSMSPSPAIPTSEVLAASVIWDTPAGVKLCGLPATASGDLACQLWDPRTGEVVANGSVPSLLDFGVYASMPGGSLWIGQGLA